MLLKTFRLFVSSTFADFTQERELLQSKVFPNLDAYCAVKGYQFHAIDLRWGVNEEAQLDQRTAEICLSEVAAAKGYPSPNFLVMIGSRYGWVPLPFAIAQDEFEAALAWLVERGRVDAVSELCKIYRLDENFLTPPGLAAAADSGDRIGAYTLRSRENAEYARADAWERLESRLRGALQEAADHLWREDRIGEVARAKYFLSLTEQEVFQGLPGYARADNYGPQAIAWIREQKGADDPRVEMFKAGIRRSLPDDCVLSGRAIQSWRGRLKTTYLDNFVARIERRLREAIDKHIAERSEDNELLQDRAQHEAFAEGRRSIFVGRENNLLAIESYLVGESPHPLALFGPSGLGKSALLAQAVGKASGRGVPVVHRFVGASAASADVRSLLISIVEDLAANGIAIQPDHWEDDANKFDAQVRTLLTSLERPVVIFVDALDQLKKPRLGWLPNKLPPGVRLVVSALNDDTYNEESGVYRALRQRLPDEAFLEIEPLTEHGRDILLALEKGANRRLRPGQRDYILVQFKAAGASPLYLRVAFEIAQSWHSWDEAGVDRCALAGDTAALIGQLIAELTSVHHHEPELVSRTLGYLAAAKDGLSAKEITEILSRDDVVMTAISSERYGTQTRRLPDSVSARLYRQLAPLLIEKRIDGQQLLQFFHRQLTDIVRERHYEPAHIQLHAALAEYFDTSIISRDRILIYSNRSLAELPYQLHHAGNGIRLDRILTSPAWMEQKLVAFGLQNLIADYVQLGQTKMQALIGRTLQLLPGILARDSRQLLPQLAGRFISVKEEGTKAFLAAARREVARPALFPVHDSLTPPGAEEVRIEGHEGAVIALIALTDGRLASASIDKSIRIWDVKTGVEIVRLEGHRGSITSLGLLADGRLVSGAADNTIRFWDIASGSEVALIDVSASWALCPLPGARLASGSEDGIIRLWDLKNNVEISRFDCGTHVVALCELSDGRLASGSMDYQVRLWSISSGAVTKRLRVKTGMATLVGALCPLGDGQLAVGASDAFGSARDTITFWNVDKGAKVGSLQGHLGSVNALCALSRRRLASSADDDETFAFLPRGGSAIRLWDLEQQTEIARLDGHADTVRALCSLPDGRLASAGNDCSIRLWNVESAGSLARFSHHADPVRALCVLPNGLVASGSGDSFGAKDKSIRLWNAKSGAEIRRMAGDIDAVLALCALPDGRLVSSSGSLETMYEGTIQLWDVTAGVEIGRLEQHKLPVLSLCALSDRRLVSGSHDGTIRLWNVERRKWRKSPSSDYVVLGNGLGPVKSLEALAKGEFASAHGGDVIRLWSGSGTQSGQLQCSSGVVALASVPHGGLAAALSDHTIEVWDVVSRSKVASLRGHSAAVAALAPLRGGRIASCSEDYTIRLWDTRNAKEMTRLEVEAPAVSIAAQTDDCLVAGDKMGWLHWLKIVD
jgi:WD40 repeat protein